MGVRQRYGKERPLTEPRLRRVQSPHGLVHVLSVRRGRCLCGFLWGCQGWQLVDADAQPTCRKCVEALAYRLSTGEKEETTGEY